MSGCCRGFVWRLHNPILRFCLNRNATPEKCNYGYRVLQSWHMETTEADSSFPYVYSYKLMKDSIVCFISVELVKVYILWQTHLNCKSSPNCYNLCIIKWMNVYFGCIIMLCQGDLLNCSPFSAHSQLHQWNPLASAWRSLRRYKIMN